MDQLGRDVMRLVQFNVENLFLFMDQYKGQDLNSLKEDEWQRLSYASVPNKPLLKTLKLARAIKDISPDVLMLNEVGGLESLENFSRYFLDHLYQPYLIEGNSDRGIDVGYLVKKSLPFRYLLNSHKNRPLDFIYPHEEMSNEFFEQESPEKVVKSHYFSRDALELRLYRPEAPRPALVLLLTHLKSKLDPDGIDPQGRERRAAELKTLLEIYNELKDELGPDTPIAVAGDFNGLASRQACEPEMKVIYEESDLEDVLDIAGVPQEERATQIQIPRGGRPLLNQIDYIFASPRLAQIIDPRESYVYRFKSELSFALPLPKTLPEKLLLPSDHYPVVTGIKLSEL